MQKQIQALKQENELLELQQKNEALKRRESSAEIAEQIEAIKAENEALKAKKAENNKIIKKGFLGFCRGKYSPTGCFIGGELGVGFGESYFNWFNTNPAVTQKVTMPSINGVFGYQWYYMQSQGIKVRAHIGYGYYQNNIQSGEEYTYKFNTNAIQYGLELAWLWDFVRKGKHTLGIDLGTGFEGSTFFHSTKKENDEYNNEYRQGGQVTSRLVGSNTQVVWVSRIGLHYYFNVNHQFFLNYAYKGYSSINGAEIFNEIDGKKQGEGIGYFANYARNRIYLGYSYKF